MYSNKNQNSPYNLKSHTKLKIFCILSEIYRSIREEEMTEQLDKCQKCGYEGVMIKDTFDEKAAEFDELIIKHRCPKCRNTTADILRF